MGAQDFQNEYRGTAPIDVAYRELVDQAYYDHGHAGYTGTIAETPGFILDPGVKEPMTTDEALTRAQDWDRAVKGEEYPEKWGPAWAIPLKPDPDFTPEPSQWWTPPDQTQPGWLFYGIASC